MIGGPSRMIRRKFQEIWGAISASYLPGNQVDGLPGAISGFQRMQDDGARAGWTGSGCQEGALS